MKMRLVDGVVVDLAEDPASAFHPAIAEEFVPVPAGAPADLRPGFRFADGTWTPAPEPTAAPNPEVPGPVYRTQMSVARFKAQFPLRAQIAVELARAYVPTDPAKPDLALATRKAGLDVLYGMLADLNQAGTPVDVADPAVAGGVDWMAAEGFLTEDEAAEIKRGVPVAAG